MARTEQWDTERKTKQMITVRYILCSRMCGLAGLSHMHSPAQYAQHCTGARSIDPWNSCGIRSCNRTSRDIVSTYVCYFLTYTPTCMGRTMGSKVSILEVSTYVAIRNRHKQRPNFHHVFIMIKDADMVGALLDK